MRSFVILSSIVLFLFACNKEKRYSHKLMKGETWEVRNITVDGNSLATYGQWKVTSDVDIYDSVPRVQWLVDNQDALFEWQFQKKGKVFQLNYIQLCEECDGTALDDLDYMTYDLTGSYDVERHGRKKMWFTSTTTLAYPGKLVRISIERN